MKIIIVGEGAWDRYHEQFHNSPPHIDSIINPEIEVVKTIEKLLVVPGAVDVGDRIIIFAKQQAISKIEKFLTVKLDFI